MRSSSVRSLCSQRLVRWSRRFRRPRRHDRKIRKTRRTRKRTTRKDPKKDEKKDKKDEKSDESKVEVYQGKDGWRFRIVGPDGKSVAIGVQPYATKEECLAAVEVVKATLGKAKLKEPQKD